MVLSIKHGDDLVPAKSIQQSRFRERNSARMAEHRLLDALDVEAVVVGDHQAGVRSAARLRSNDSIGRAPDGCGVAEKFHLRSLQGQGGHRCKTTAGAPVLTNGIGKNLVKMLVKPAFGTATES